MKKTLKILFVLVAVVIVGIVFTLSGKQVTSNSIIGDNIITVYKSQSCGCCDQYVGYLRGQGIQVNVENINNMDAIKSKYKIPGNMQSCHTSVIGDYFVEGHIPLEAIQKLRTEKSDRKSVV